MAKSTQPGVATPAAGREGRRGASNVLTMVVAVFGALALVGAAGLVAELFTDAREPGGAGTATMSQSGTTDTSAAVVHRDISDLQDLMGDIGYEFTPPRAEAHPAFTEDQALRLTHSDISYGLVRIGSEYADPNQPGAYVTRWRLCWVTSNRPRWVTATPFNYTDLQTFKTRDVFFVDATSGDIFRSFSL